MDDLNAFGMGWEPTDPDNHPEEDVEAAKAFQEYIKEHPEEVKAQINRFFDTAWTCEKCEALNAEHLDACANPTCGAKRLSWNRTA